MKFLCLGKKKDSSEGGSVGLFTYNHIELYLIIKNKYFVVIFQFFVQIQYFLWLIIYLLLF